MGYYSSYEGTVTMTPEAAKIVLSAFPDHEAFGVQFETDPVNGNIYISSYDRKHYHADDFWTYLSGVKDIDTVNEIHYQGEEHEDMSTYFIYSHGIWDCDNYKIIAPNIPDTMRSRMIAVTATKHLDEVSDIKLGV